MTREEAIKFAECLKNNWTINFDDLEPFCNMAIEALKSKSEMISAQQERAIKDCRNCKFGDYNDHWNTNFCYCSDDCNNWDKWEPSAQPRKGKWIKISPANIYECSVCGQNAMTNDIEAYKFCHGCGVEMERRQE